MHTPELSVCFGGDMALYKTPHLFIYLMQAMQTTPNDIHVPIVNL
jgi:hypothetical protein